ncbi:MAG TPA: tRNA epoxyqueuosine(34) reductase QueG [Chloroflexota bacterium]|nr:tRNA epoxyqueuosine(34) reductase QueG [Chloroflexota bacterium]
MSLALEPHGGGESATRRVKEIGRDVGFDLVRIAGAAPLTVEAGRFQAWLAGGRHGEMRWLTPEWAERASRPASVLASARSVISVGLSYGRGPSIPERSRGRIARYAWGGDYHTFMGDRLEEMIRHLNAEFGGEHRAYVDTGPLMDKAFGARAGIGWYGKHTNLISPVLGSFFVLGEIVTTLELEPDTPLSGACGSCRLCQVACPTGALDRDYTIDARRCISYLTIEHRGPIPVDLRPLIGSWVFGCDICQDVCPPGNAPYLRDGAVRRAWSEDTRRYVSRASPKARETDRSPVFGRPARDSVDLVWLLNLDHRTYLDAFRGTALRRAKVWMLRRNAAIALGNVGDESALGPLSFSLTRDEHPIIRGHAAWAIGNISRRLGTSIGGELLEALRNELDDHVRTEIADALCQVSAGSPTSTGSPPARSRGGRDLPSPGSPFSPPHRMRQKGEGA